MITKRELMIQLVQLECQFDELLERVEKLEKPKKTTRSKKK